MMLDYTLVYQAKCPKNSEDIHSMPIPCANLSSAALNLAIICSGDVFFPLFITLLLSNQSVTKKVVPFKGARSKI